jgi:hypothetical protein
MQLLEVRRRLSLEIGQGINVGFDVVHGLSFRTELDAATSEAAGQGGYHSIFSMTVADLQGSGDASSLLGVSWSEPRADTFFDVGDDAAGDAGIVPLY